MSKRLFYKKQDMTDDPFFKENPKYANLGSRNRSMADYWAAIGTDYNGIYTGQINSFRANIVLEYPLENSAVKVSTVRQLQSGESTFYPRIAELTEETLITIKCAVKVPRIWIAKKGFFADCWAYLSRAKHHNENYWMNGGDASIQHSLLNLPYLKQSLITQTLVSLSIHSKKRLIRMKFAQVFESKEAIRELVKFTNTINAVFNLGQENV